MKRILALFLVFTLAFGAPQSALAAKTSAKEATTESTAEKAAEASTAAEKGTEDTPSAASAEDTGAAYGVDDLSGAPEITAESAVVMDAASGAILYAKEADAKRYPASITKVMTALLAIENCKMSDIVTFSNSAVNGIEAGSSTAGINVGAKLTMEDTLYALMLVSANEAGAAIAEHISGSTEKFAALMTERAKELGCTGTQFKNPHGLPDEEHYTTAHDMGLIMKEAMKHEEFCKISGTLSHTLKKSDTLNSTVELWNHARILQENSEYYYEYAQGAKTGFTQAALNTLVTYAKKDNIRLICVILKDYGADNSYYDTAKLFKWAYSQVKQTTPLTTFHIKDAISENTALDTAAKDRLNALDLQYNEDFTVLVGKDVDTSGLSAKFVLDEKDKTEGIVGHITISYKDKEIGETAVTFDTESEAGKNYLAGKDVNDNLKTAPVKSKRKDLIHKGMEYAVRILIAAILVFLIMRFIHKRELESRRKRRIDRRNRRNNKK